MFCATHTQASTPKTTQTYRAFNSIWDTATCLFCVPATSICSAFPAPRQNVSLTDNLRHSQIALSQPDADFPALRGGQGRRNNQPRKKQFRKIKKDSPRRENLFYLVEFFYFCFCKTEFFPPCSAAVREGRGGFPPPKNSARFRLYKSVARSSSPDFAER